MTSRFQFRAEPQTALEIIRVALRDAALSDRPNDAIDLLAEALVRLAAIDQVEVRHG